jgi:hypothetical protein
MNMPYRQDTNLVNLLIFEIKNMKKKEKKKEKKSKQNNNYK